MHIYNTFPVEWCTVQEETGCESSHLYLKLCCMVGLKKTIIIKFCGVGPHWYPSFSQNTDLKSILKNIFRPELTWLELVLCY